jgi:Family of unknown function (DUF6141)
VTETSPKSPASPVYKEEQRFRQWWIWAIVIAPATLAWLAFIAQIIRGKPVGQNPAPDWLVWVIWLLIGIGLPLLFGRMALVLEVTPERVLVRYRPFTRRAIALADIERVEERTYNAIKEYGGWGVKGWSKEKMAYNVRGDRGVELTLKDGRRVMLGSQRADELAAAIEAQRRALRPGRRRTSLSA